MTRRQRFGLLIILWSLWGFDVAARNPEFKLFLIAPFLAFIIGGILLAMD